MVVGYQIERVRSHLRRLRRVRVYSKLLVVNSKGHQSSRSHYIVWKKFLKRPLGSEYFIYQGVSFIYRVLEVPLDSPWIRPKVSRVKTSRNFMGARPDWTSTGR